MSDLLINALQFGALPTAAALVVYFAKRKRLWTAPFLSSGLFLLIRWVLQPNIFTQAEWRAFLWMATMMHFCAAAAITFVVSRAAKNKR